MHLYILTNIQNYASTTKIDILQEYNLKKKVEHNYKAKLLGKDPYALSAVNSVVYGDRFINFVLKEVGTKIL